MHLPGPEGKQAGAGGEGRREGKAGRRARQAGGEGRREGKAGGRERQAGGEGRREGKAGRRGRQETNTLIRGRVVRLKREPAAAALGGGRAAGRQA